MSFTDFWNNTDARILAAIIGGAVLVINAFINSLVNIIFMKRRVRLEVAKVREISEGHRIAETLGPILSDIEKTLAIAGRANWGNPDVLLKIEDHIHELESYVPTTLKLKTVLLKIEVLFRKNWSTEGGLFLTFTHWSMKSKTDRLVRKARRRIAKHRAKWS